MSHHPNFNFVRRPYVCNRYGPGTLTELKILGAL